MWPKIAAASALLLIQGGAVAQDCPYTVSVLDVPGVRCVSSAPCSGTYYASGLSQGVGACPSGSSCALLPETPIMGCAAAGRTDLIYVNADGTLTKDGKSVTFQDSTTTTTTTSTPTTAPSTTSSNTGSKSSTSSSSTGSKSSTSSSNGSKSTTGSSSTAHGSNSNASSGSSSNANADGGSDASTDSSNSTISDSASASNSSSSSSSNSSSSSDSMSGSVVSPGSSSANQQSFNPGSILSDGSSTINKAAGSGLSLGAVIGIVVGCLAVVAIAAGARLLQKGKEAEGELTTPEGAAMEGYNGGAGGGSGMTPKENVLLL